jgi:hypothetical protein
VQFDRHGNRIWHQAKALLDSEHARRAVGEVAVPFGGCAEPSNVKAGRAAVIRLIRTCIMAASRRSVQTVLSVRRIRSVR